MSCKNAGGFDVGGIIEQDQRLLRNVGTIAFGGALFAARRVEGQEAGVKKRSLPPGVKPASVLLLVLISHIRARGKIQIIPVTVGLIRLNARAADFVRKQ